MINTTQFYRHRFVTGQRFQWVTGFSINYRCKKGNDFNGLLHYWLRGREYYHTPWYAMIRYDTLWYGKRCFVPILGFYRHRFLLISLNKSRFVQVCADKNFLSAQGHVFVFIEWIRDCADCADRMGLVGIQNKKYKNKQCTTVTCSHYVLSFSYSTWGKRDLSAQSAQIGIYSMFSVNV